MQTAEGKVWYDSRSIILSRCKCSISNDLDRAQPSCGWCTRNAQVCEYKERKKPGLRAGYGKELEQRLGMCSSPCYYSKVVFFAYLGTNRQAGGYYPGASPSN